MIFQPLILQNRWLHLGLALTLLGVLIVASVSIVTASPPVGNPATYTFDADFAEGTLVNLNFVDVPDQLQLDSEATPFEFIWVAASVRGTIVKIDTVTGDVLGEYWSAPDGRGRDPSRTTVDGNGNVWAGNRAEASGGQGSVVHIGLLENGQCVDRNGNGLIDTSTGLGDIKPWTNAGGTDNNGGVSTAEDECIIHYVRTTGTNVRTVAVDADNDVWVGGYGYYRYHEKIDGATGTIVPGTKFNYTIGGYGGLIDGKGILWSSSGPSRHYLLRYDPATKAISVVYLSNLYGLGVDGLGNIWTSRWTNDAITKLDFTGTQLGTFSTYGASNDRGVTVTPDNDVWVANSGGNNVSRLNNDGTFDTLINVGDTPTGLAVDAAGKVWVTNYDSHNVMRIDPATNNVDLTVDLGGGAYPYNYSDMTGSTLIAPPKTGTWTVVHDSEMVDAPWRNVSWNSSEPPGSSITVQVASSTDGVSFNPPETVTNGIDLAATPPGQFLKVTASFSRADGFEPSPVLFDLTVLANRLPTADANGPYYVDEGSDVMLDGTGSSDPDGDELTYAWDLDNDSTFETPGATPFFSAAGLDGPSTHPVALQVCDPFYACDTASAEVNVINVPPTPDAGADQTVYRNDVVSVSGTWTDPAGSLDEPYGWSWDLDGDGSADSLGTASYGDTIEETTSFALEGTYPLTFEVTDKDGGAGSDSLNVEVLNRPPDCSNANPSVDIIWPPNHEFVPISVLDVSDPEGDEIVITIDSILQDEPVDTEGDGSFTPDGQGVGTDTAEVRAERAGGENGRVYHIFFTADDGHGGSCSGEMLVGVPHEVKDTPIDGGALYDSTLTP